MKRTTRSIGLAILTLVVAASAVAAVTSTASGEVGSSDWKMLSGGDRHTCGIRTSGELYCWGLNDQGQLGDATLDPRATPTKVALGFTDWASVSAGGNSTCALRVNRRLYCWGSNNGGSLGVGDEDPRSVPTQVAGSFTSWTSVSVGTAHACGRRSTGRLYCWGSNPFGALGLGDKQPRLTPTEVSGQRTDWADVSAGSFHTCARRSTGRLFCWGYNVVGQVGNGTETQAALTPRQVAGGLTDWTSVSAGGAHTCAGRSSGGLFCWGGNSTGQLGVGTTDAGRSTPTQVAGGLTSWRSVDAGGEHTCARRSTGRLYCWGYNMFGQLGDRSEDNRDAPVQVAGGATDWKTLGTGDYHMCATITSGRAYCWGRGGDGQLGDGTSSTYSTPNEVYSP